MALIEQMAMPMRRAVIILVAGLTATAVAARARPAQAAPPAVDFVRDVQPILSTHCYECHGPKAKGGLRLDLRAGATRGGASGNTIVTGKSADSAIIHRLKGEGGEDRMPLRKPALADAEIATIAAWIDQGAPWPDSAAVNGPPEAPKHWSFIKPVRPAEPAVKDAAWVRNPIDRFVLARLEREGIKPSPEAPRETLLRRLTQINAEGGIDPEQFRVEAVIDRVNTTATVFLGLTVACAQCHNHKFDPVAQKEYYRLFAFFNNCDEPEMRLGDAEAQARGR